MSWDVVGHEKVKAQLRTVRASSLLFVGPDAVGRRRMALWYAAWRNCAEPGEEPCGVCASCVAAARGEHPDLLVKAPPRSNRAGQALLRPQLTIDQLVPRSGPDKDPDPLSRWLEQRPRFRRRVGVIDGAETLNASAANAFLKMLEQPPSWASLVLIAPSPQAVLPTVASRCTPLRFAAPPTEGYEDLAPHPALRAGRLGALRRTREDPSAYEAIWSAAEAWLAALDDDLATALEATAGLEKAWTAHPEAEPGALVRELLRREARHRYPLALDALDEMERAMEAHVSASLALQVLTLRLRAR